MSSRPDSEPPWRIAVAADLDAYVAYMGALEELCESVSAFEAAPGGAWRVEGLTRAPPDRADAALRLALAAAALGRAPPEVEIARLPRMDWLAENRRAFPRLRVGRFFVYGTHHAGAVPAGALAIKLDASMAFGSGQHATTQGCLLAIDRALRTRRCRSALDLGCGSGILAIALARAGARRVDAVDIDPDSVRLARENACANRVSSRLRVALGARPPRRRHDFVVANILAGPLVRLSGAIARAAEKRGTIVLSGLLASQEAEVLSAYRRRRWRLARRIARAGWHTLVLKR